MTVTDQADINTKGINMKLDADKFQCEMCKGVFIKSWTDEEANKEAKRIWDIDNAMSKVGSSLVEICDDCFQKIHPSKFPELWDQEINRIHKENI